MPSASGLVAILFRVVSPALLALILVGAWTVPGEAILVDVTSGPLGDPGNSFGVAWGDYDNDGDDDLYITKSSGTNRLLRNDGNDVFVDVTSGPLADPGSGFGAAWGDYDNDHDLDLYIANEGFNRLLRNDGGGNFADVTTPVLADVSSSQSVGWADYDQDGDVDLYVTNFDAGNRLFRNDGGGVFYNDATVVIGTGDCAGFMWADYDDDGDQDLFVGGFQGSRLYRNVGGGLFANVTTDALDLPGVTGVTFGDYDNDGDLDLYLARDLVQNALLRNDGPASLGNPGGFVQQVNGPLQDNDAGTGTSWADYDNDGDLDLFLGNLNDETELWRNEGFGVFVEITNLPLEFVGAVEGLAWADYDCDGDLDLYMAVVDGPSRLFRNDLVSNNHWLHVQLEDWKGDRYAIGSRVRLVAGGIQQIREVESCVGLYSQNSLAVEFGLGSTTSIALLEVTWPDGQVDSVSVPGVDRKLKVTRKNKEVTGVRTVHPPLPLSNHPNPFHLSTRIRYELPTPAPVYLHILDVSGRVVRHLQAGLVQPAGSHEVLWDGRNDHGLAVAPGVYFYRVDAGERQAARKLILSP